MAELHSLEDELRALGQTLVVDPPREDLVEQVLARLPAGRRPRRTPWAWLMARRRRLVAVVIAAVLLGLGLTPPVRAAVVEWLRIGGVLIQTAPATRPSSTPQPPPRTGQTVTLAEARDMVSFPVGVPAALDMPERIAVSDDRQVVSMDWGSGAGQVHLDQFDGRVSWLFLKKRAPEQFTVVAVNGRDAVWFPTAHEVSYIDRSGRDRTEQSRIAGPCLIWERLADGALVTVRLEGNLERTEAIRVAESMR